MRRAVLFLTALLVLNNVVLAGHMHVDIFDGQHLAGSAMHGGSNGHDGPHPLCDHCCHAQGHFLSILQMSTACWHRPAVRDWTVAEFRHPHCLLQAPPLPPPIHFA